MNTDIRSQIQSLADKYAKQLDKQITHRMQEMLQDDRSHYLIYRVLGIHEDEGMLIDAYQNRGRFLYKYAGAFLEEACVLCIQSKYPDAKKLRFPIRLPAALRTLKLIALWGIWRTKSNGEMQRRMGITLRKSMCGFRRL